MRTSDNEKASLEQADSGSKFITTGDAPKPAVENDDELDYLTAD